MNSDN